MYIYIITYIYIYIYIITDYHLFLSLPNFFRGKKFKNKDIKQALVNFFTSKDEIFFKNGIYKLLARWQEVINNNGNYII